MEVICSSEMSGTTQRTTGRHIPEEDTLQNHRYENLKSYVKLFACNSIFISVNVNLSHSSPVNFVLRDF
jgi:hypothetical protein